VNKLAPADLMSLEQYARERPGFRARVLAHKSDRQLAVGPHATWCFEDRLTVQYQVQEMLRTERIFEPHGILDELGAYNPLIPDGSNWKVTLLIEFADCFGSRGRRIHRIAARLEHRFERKPRRHIVIDEQDARQFKFECWWFPAGF